MGTDTFAGGDLNGDGLGDVILSAHLGGPGDEGEAYLLYGPVYGEIRMDTAPRILVGEETGDRAGARVTSLGDVNGDGLGDVAIGAPAYPAGDGQGRVYISFGRP